MIAVLNDAQTSGGLIIAIEPTKATVLLEEMHKAGLHAVGIFGEVVEGAPGVVEVEP